MYKLAKRNEDARSKILEGINLVADLVGSTIGPKGKNVVLSEGAGSPIVTNDGVTIATRFNVVEDPWVNTGVQMIKEASMKSNIVGDGTTTTTVIAQSLINSGEKQLLAGQDAHDLIASIKEDFKNTTAKLSKMAKPVKTKQDLIQVATVSTEDTEMGQLIGEIMYEVGQDGAVTVETSKDVKLEKAITEGVKFDQGFVSEYYMTNPRRQEAVFENAPILVTNHIISHDDEIVPLANALAQKNIRVLVIVCDDIKGQALVTTINNSIKGQFNFLVIRLPGLDEARTLAGQDLAIACGANFIDSALKPIEEVSLNDLGSATRVISNREDTVVVGGAGKKSDVKERIAVLRAEIEAAISDYDRDNLRERIARLSQSIGVVRLGAATQQELTYKKHKVEDGLAATRAAMEEGIVLGGGVALLRAIPEKCSELFKSAIRAPITRIAENAGKNADIVVEHLMDLGKPSYGWDARTNEYKDFVKYGIIDPVKVTKKALENAVSIAVGYLSIGGLVVDQPEGQKPKIPGRVHESH